MIVFFVVCSAISTFASGFAIYYLIDICRTLRRMERRADRG